MSNKIKISAAANVEIPAYLALREKGYKVRWENKNNEIEYWYAEKNNQQFIAEGPIELLGIVSVFEIRGKNWKATDSEINTFMEKYKNEI